MEDLPVTISSMPTQSFWNGKRVLLTGHTGFKGSWLGLWLSKLGAKIIGISLPPQTTPNLFNELAFESSIESHICDVCDYDNLANLVLESQPEVVFHLAAQALVRESYKEPLTTFSTNVLGTANLLEALRRSVSVKVALMVTTDKVYANKEWIYPYRETDRLGGHDPYSASKAASEHIITCYRETILKDLAIASVRAGNVIGGGDWAADRLVPDAIRAWQKKETLHIRRPHATRPWQHVLEPLRGYMMMAEQLWDNPELSGAYNLGPDKESVVPVGELVELARPYFQHANVAYAPFDGSLPESGRLALDTSKAREVFQIEPRWGLNKTLDRTISWYRSFSNGENAISLCLDDLAHYEST